MVLCVSLISARAIVSSLTYVMSNWLMITIHSFFVFFIIPPFTKINGQIWRIVGFREPIEVVGLVRVTEIIMFVSGRHKVTG